MDNIRNKWVLIVGILFVALILLISAYGGTTSRRESGIQGFEFTILVGSNLVVMFISIIAVIMGKGAIVNEVEAKSIALILTSELGRKDVVIGKFVGLAFVLATSLVGGLGIGGIIIGLLAGFEGAATYAEFLLLSLLFGLNYLSISMCMSSFVGKTSRALAFGVFIWFFYNMIWSLVLFAILIATGWEFPMSPTSTITYPDWYHFAGLGNPNTIYAMAISRLSESLMIYGGNIPASLHLPLLVGLLLFWILVPLLIAVVVFEYKDIG